MTLITLTLPPWPLPEETATLLCEDLSEISWGISDWASASENLAIESPLALASALDQTGSKVSWCCEASAIAADYSSIYSSIHSSIHGSIHSSGNRINNSSSDSSSDRSSDSLSNSSSQGPANDSSKQLLDNPSDIEFGRASVRTSSRSLNFANPAADYFYGWPKNPSLLALVPHWRCESWLAQALTSLVQQTHPPTHIAVIDDASPHPPMEIVKEFPTVTLLTAAERVGPYGLIQSVIGRTDYIAYLFQDADDWSSCDRIARLLQTARQHRAHLVGSQEIRILEPGGQLQAVGYPLDVNQALARKPGHALLHPTSLVTRQLVTRLGGFASGLPFGGDTEFLLRSHWLARIVNCDRYCYFRRKRPHSLTTAAETGLDSSARRDLLTHLKQRADVHRQQAAQGISLDLQPLKQAAAVDLAHLCGPLLQGW